MGLVSAPAMIDSLPLPMAECGDQWGSGGVFNLVRIQPYVCPGRGLGGTGYITWARLNGRMGKKESGDATDSVEVILILPSLREAPTKQFQDGPSLDKLALEQAPSSRRPSP